MKSNLKELKKDDWNTLFPIELSDHNPAWKTIFEAEKRRILSGVGDNTVLRVEHFGSSSIPGIKAKPYIDILIEIPQEALFGETVIQQFEALGYTYFKVPERKGIAAYMSFGKGYSLNGEKEQIFHLHMCPKENVMWSQIKFRDYLREHQERAKEYESLKVKLSAQFRNDRGAYLLGKADFINETMDLIQSEQP